MSDDNVHDSRTDLPAVTPENVADATIKRLKGELEEKRRECAYHASWANGFFIAAAILCITAGLGWGLFADRGDDLSALQKNMDEAQSEVAYLKADTRWQGGSAFYWYNEYQRVGENKSNNISTNAAIEAIKTAKDGFYSPEEVREAVKDYTEGVAQRQRDEWWNTKKKFAEEMVKSWFYRPIPSKPDGKLFINALPCDIVTYPVVVDYSITLEEIVKAGKISKDSRITFKDFPAQRTGKAKIQMKFVHFKHNLFGERLIEELSRMGLRPADLYELSAFASAYLDLRTEFSIAAFGSQNPNDEYVRGNAIPYLGRSLASSGNYFGVISDTINFDTGHWMFAAVPK